MTLFEAPLSEFSTPTPLRLQSPKFVRVEKGNCSAKNCSASNKTTIIKTLHSARREPEQQKPLSIVQQMLPHCVRPI